MLADTIGLASTAGRGEGCGVRAAGALRFLSRAVPRLLPAVLVNSVPKSGTNLLRRAVDGLASTHGLRPRNHIRHVTPAGRGRSDAELVEDVLAMRRGEVRSVHLLHTPDAAAAVASVPGPRFFVVRDPRDVVVSFVHYVTDMATGHPHHAWFRGMEHHAERLTTAIVGGRGPRGEELPDLGARLAPFLGWLDEPEVVAVRFEDLVGDERPGFRRVAEELARSSPWFGDVDEVTEILLASTAPHGSPTFRSGRVGGWRRELSPTHVALVEERAAPLLEALVRST